MFIENKPIRQNAQRDLAYTDQPLLPWAPGFDLDKYNATQWRARCIEQSPPICPWCGAVYKRRDQFAPGISALEREMRTFCKQACYQHWKRSLALRLMPREMRAEIWPGKNKGVSPPKYVDYHYKWSRQRVNDEGVQVRALVKCPAICSGFPTQSFPLDPDKRGKQCTYTAGWGTPHLGYGECRSHGGAKPKRQLRIERQHLLLLLKEEEIMFGEKLEIQPEDAIMQELWRSNGAVEWYRQKIENLASGSTEDEALVQFTKLGMTPSVWVEMYNGERDRLANTAKVAASMGVAERQIRIVEEQGRMLATVIQALMSHPGLALTPMQQINAKDAIRDVLSTIKMPQELMGATVVLPDGLTKQAHDFLDIDAQSDDFDEL